MRTNLLRSLCIVFACWYGAALLLWGFADPPQNAAVHARAHAFLPWLIPAPPKEVGILNAWQVQLQVFKSWGSFILAISLGSVAVGLLLAYLRIQKVRNIIHAREAPRGEYRGMKISLGQLPLPDQPPHVEALEIEHDDPLFQNAPQPQRELFSALAGYLAANPQVPSEGGRPLLDEALERAELALRVRRSFVSALTELAYACGRVGLHHRQSNPPKPGEKVGFPKTQGYYAAKVLGAMPQWYALDENTRTEVLFGAKYYENPLAKPYRMGAAPPVPPVPLPTAAAMDASAAPAASTAAPSTALDSGPAAMPPAAVPAPVPTAVVPAPTPTTPPAAPPPAVQAATPIAAPAPAPVSEPPSSIEAAAEGGLLQARFFTDPPAPHFTIEDHLVRSVIPLLKGVEWGHAKVPRHEYQSEKNPNGRPLPFGWRHSRFILLLSNRLEEYLRLKLPAPMVEEADSIPPPAELQRRGLKISGLMAALMRGLAKYEILHTELELDKPKGYVCRALMPEVSLWTVKVGKARFKQVIVLRLRKSYVQYVTDEDGNFKDGMTVLDCYLPEKPIPTEGDTPAIAAAVADNTVSMADAVSMGLFKPATPPAPAQTAAPAPPPVPLPAPEPAQPSSTGADGSSELSLHDLFNDATQASVPELAAVAPAPAPTPERAQRPKRHPRHELDPLQAAGLQPKPKPRHEP